MDLIRSSYKQSRLNELNMQMSNTRKQLDYYMNDQVSYLADKLTKIFSKTWMNNFMKIAPITERVINAQSKMFDNQCTILLDAPDADIVLFNEVLSTSNLHSLLVHVNRLTNLTGKVGVMPRYINGKIVYDILTQDRCIVNTIEGFPTEPESVMYWIGQDQKKRNTWIKITNDSISKVQLKTDYSIDKQYDIEDNPYGYIPIAWFTNTINVQSFWPQCVNPIVQYNEYHNIHKSFQSLAVLYQSYSTLVLTNTNISIQDIPHGPSHCIPLKNNGLDSASPDAKYITPDTKFSDIKIFIDDFQAHAVQYAGLSAQAYKKTAFTSGYQMQLAMAQIISKNTSQIPFYNMAIKDICKMIIDTWNIYDDASSIAVGEISVQFAKIQISKDPLEQWSVWQKELANGIISPIDIIMQKYQISKQDALVLYNNNRAYSVENAQIQQ